MGLKQGSKIITPVYCSQSGVLGPPPAASGTCWKCSFLGPPTPRSQCPGGGAVTRALRSPWGASAPSRLNPCSSNAGGHGGQEVSLCSQQSPGSALGIPGSRPPSSDSPSVDFSLKTVTSLAWRLTPWH